MKETIGRLDNHGKVLGLERWELGHGYGYKNYEAYLNDKYSICYVPAKDKEHSDDIFYTGQDLLAICNDQSEIADRIFDLLDGKKPERLYDQLKEHGDLGICSCGKLYSVFARSSTCLYCGKELVDKAKYIRLHRIFWNKIADENRKGEMVDKKDVIKEMRQEGLMDGLEDPKNDNFLCEYVARKKALLGQSCTVDCAFCPLKWGETNSADCTNDPGLSNDGLYDKWHRANKRHFFQDAEEIARTIADLPEKE